ncbi:MAG TPA: glycosyltransferase family 2 protein, partial [Pirellulales bacterium]|nr:glycosyltransferase family 2 protein [Pirellulales bacterium]
ITYNEAPNIGRCLERLRWAADVVVVDSFSTDETLSIAERFPNVRVVQRRFDDFASQWQFGLEESGIATPWVLALDADYMVSESFLNELRAADAMPEISAFEARFRYAVFGHELRGGAYPPVCALFRRDACRYVNDGHAYRLRVLSGKIVPLRSPLVHDDRKPLSRWLQSQATYMDQELTKLLNTPRAQLGFVDRLRTKLVIAPPGVFLYSLLLKGGILDGWPGWFYALQRLVAESLLSLKLLEYRLRGPKVSQAREVLADAVHGGRGT